MQPHKRRAQHSLHPKVQFVPLAAAKADSLAIAAAMTCGPSVVEHFFLTTALGGAFLTTALGGAFLTTALGGAVDDILWDGVVLERRLLAQYYLT
jgi:hypothetical protein